MSSTNHPTPKTRRSRLVQPISDCHRLAGAIINHEVATA
jgi:hypothetical protein